MAIINRKSAGSILFLSILQGLNVLVPLFIMPYLLKVLGVHQFGVLSFALAVVQYYILIVDFGFNLSATNRIAVNRDNSDSVAGIFWSTLYVKLLLLGAMFLLNLLLVYFVEALFVYRAAINALFLMVLGNVLFPVWLFLGLERMKLVTIINVIAKVSVLPLTFYLVKRENDILIAAQLQAFVFVAAGLLSFAVIWLYKLIPLTPGKFHLSLMKKEFRESSPVFFSNVAVSMYTIAFTVILGFLVNSVAVGYYSAAEKIIRALTFLVYVPISQVFFPKISHLHSIDEQAAKRLLKQVGYILILIMLVLGVVAFAATDLIIDFLGSEYRPAATLIRIMAAVPLFIAAGGIAGLGLLAFNKRQDFKMGYIKASLVAVVLVFLLTFLYNEKGTAVALTLTEFFVFVFMYQKLRSGKIA